jgi:hypothetical protein
MIEKKLNNESQDKDDEIDEAPESFGNTKNEDDLFAKINIRINDIAASKRIQKELRDKIDRNE